MSTTSSKEAHASYASHINLAAKTILPDETKIVEVDKMWTLLGYNSSDFPNVEHHVRDTEIDTMNAVQGKVFSGCLNQLSAHVRAKLGLGTCQFVFEKKKKCFAYLIIDIRYQRRDPVL